MMAPRFGQFDTPIDDQLCVHGGVKSGFSNGASSRTDRGQAMAYSLSRLNRRPKCRPRGFNEPAGFAAAHDVARAADVGHYHGKAAGHGLDGGDAKAFGERGQDEQLGTGVERLQRAGVRLRTVDADAGRKMPNVFSCDDVEGKLTGWEGAEDVEEHLPALASKVAANKEQAQRAFGVSRVVRRPLVERDTRRGDADARIVDSLRAQAVRGPVRPGRKERH